MNFLRYKLIALCAAAAAIILVIVALLSGAYYYVEPSIVPASELRNIDTQDPLRVYSRDGRFITQFGEQKRSPVPLEAVPDILIEAIIAIEDDTFFEHSGIDVPGIARAVFALTVNYLTGRDERVPGASTITQQVARDHFGSLEYSLARKFREQILALRIEREFTKQEILEIYLNTTFLGQRSYGVAAAARTYFDKQLDELTIGESAIIAGIPQGPSILNPVTDPEAARTRRDIVLGRMLSLGMISRVELELARAEPVLSTEYGPRTELDAPYVAEMVRLEMNRLFGPSSQTRGLKVTTTLDSRLQAAANLAMKEGLYAYDERHGYRGNLAQIELPDSVVVSVAPAPPGATPAPAPQPGDDGYLPPALPSIEFDAAELAGLLADYPSRAGLETALVLAANEGAARLFLPTQGDVRLGFDAVAWARPYIDDEATGAAPATVTDVLRPGDVVRLRHTRDGQWRLTQIPDVQGALVALDPADGAIAALNGGFNFYLNNYNRVTQSRRQPGSAFKAFTYSAALENGFTLASIVNDAPIVLQSTGQEDVWRPKNSTGRTYGPTPFRRAFERSLNMSAVRVVMEAGLRNVIDHVRRFGFDEIAIPEDLSLSLGAGGVAPIDLAAGYATFANGGFRVTPYFIQRVEDLDGNVLYEAEPDVACLECVLEEANRLAIEKREGRLVEDVTELYPPVRRAEQIITAQNAYLMTEMMRGVIRSGTGVRARELGRSDIAGKTGTTDDARNAWFAGFNPDLVTATWVGFDGNRPLGAGEEGARTALPMWNLFMGAALATAPERSLPMPPGIVEHRINPETGLRSTSLKGPSVFEKFRIGNEPDLELTQAGGFGENLDVAAPADDGDIF
jgi:penicillin-binding protein 1A